MREVFVTCTFCTPSDARDICNLYVQYTKSLKYRNTCMEYCGDIALTVRTRSHLASCPCTSPDSISNLPPTKSSTTVSHTLSTHTSLSSPLLSPHWCANTLFPRATPHTIRAHPHLHHLSSLLSHPSPHSSPPSRYQRHVHPLPCYIRTKTGRRYYGVSPPVMKQLSRQDTPVHAKEKLVFHSLWGGGERDAEGRERERERNGPSGSRIAGC